MVCWRESVSVGKDFPTASFSRSLDRGNIILNLQYLVVQQVCIRENVFICPSLRYEILTPNAIPKGFMDGKQACMLMVSILIEFSMSISVINR